ncbi:lasso peptide isopeptide bond-forming cyclase [soil metagenome]
MSGPDYLALLRRASRALTPKVARALERAQAEHGLVALHDSPTLTVLAPAKTPHVLMPNGGGVILGHLFDRARGAPIETHAHVALDQPPANFVALHWGGYLALRTRNGAAEVVRDPSGALPCYHLGVDDVHILAAEPGLLVDLGLVRAEIDWTIVRQALVYQDLRPARTALRGIGEIQPGVAARVLPPGLVTECAWSPWPFTERGREIADPAAAIGAVRQEVTTAISSWGRCFSQPLVEISGGLDSAIVAAVLAMADRPPAGFTFRGVSGDTDETPYAQAIAAHLSIELAVLDPDITAIDIALSESRSLARPNARSFAQALDGPERALAEKIGADAYFSGGGGDNVFSFLRSLAPVIDRMRRHGLGRGALETMADIAELVETSFWHVAVRTARRALRRRPPPFWPVDGQFLSPEAVADLPWPSGHPWLPAPEKTLPGKRAQVMSLIRVQNHLDGHGRQAHAPIVFPLLSQPVMEACLAIPSWLWCAGGRNRAIARAAFAPLLPASVTARQNKGAFDSLCVQAMSANRSEMRDLLLNGSLAREGLLDCAAIEHSLDASVPDGIDVMRLLMLADVEAWVRAWETRLSAQPPNSPP